jgi:hypothetical protein
MEFIQLAAMERNLQIFKEIQEVAGIKYSYCIIDKNGNEFLCRNKLELIDEVLNTEVPDNPFFGM